MAKSAYARGGGARQGKGWGKEGREGERETETETEGQGVITQPVGEDELGDSFYEHEGWKLSSVVSIQIYQLINSSSCGHLTYKFIIMW